MSVENEEIKNEEVKDEETPLDALTKGMDDIFNETEVINEEVKEEDKEQEEKEEDKQLDTEDSDSEEEEDGEEKAEADDSHEEKVETEPIPQNQVDIARKLGYSDEEIIKTAEDHPERLENMVRLYSEPSLIQRELPQVEVQKEEKKEVPKLDQIKLDDLGDLDPDSAKVVTTLLKAHNDLIAHTNKQSEELQRLGEQSAGIEKKEQQKVNNKIDLYFDGASDDLPELGKTATLTPAQAKVRTEVYGISKILQNTRGMSDAKALEEATLLFGLSKVDLETIEKEAEEKVKEKLNKQKKKMSPRPGGKKKVEKPVHGKDVAMEALEQGMKEIFD
jgi:hypothetical protein